MTFVLDESPPRPGAGSVAAVSSIVAQYRASLEVAYSAFSRRGRGNCKSRYATSKSFGCHTQ